MKTKTTCIAVLAAVVAMAGWLAAESPRPLPAEEQAKNKVAVEIFSKVSPREISFSRADPGPREILKFETQTLVNNEQRLPFAIVPRFVKDAPPILQGYVRLSDQSIYLFDASAGKDVPAMQHPRFATQQERGQHPVQQQKIQPMPTPLIKVDPA